MVDEVGQPPALVRTVDNALKILVHNATEEFGFAPRDVYDGVFQLYETRDKHSLRWRSSTMPNCKRPSDRSLRIMDSLQKPCIAWS